MFNRYKNQTGVGGVRRHSLLVVSWLVTAFAFRKHLGYRFGCCAPILYVFNFLGIPIPSFRSSRFSYPPRKCTIVCHHIAVPTILRFFVRTSAHPDNLLEHTERILSEGGTDGHLACPEVGNDLPYQRHFPDRVPLAWEVSSRREFCVHRRLPN